MYKTLKQSQILPIGYLIDALRFQGGFMAANGKKHSIFALLMAGAVLSMAVGCATEEAVSAKKEQKKAADSKQSKQGTRDSSDDDMIVINAAAPNITDNPVSEVEWRSFCLRVQKEQGKHPDETRQNCEPYFQY